MVILRKLVINFFYFIHINLVNSSLVVFVTAVVLFFLVKFFTFNVIRAIFKDSFKDFIDKTIPVSESKIFKYFNIFLQIGFFIYIAFQLKFLGFFVFNYTKFSIWLKKIIFSDRRISVDDDFDNFDYYADYDISNYSNFFRVNTSTDSYNHQIDNVSNVYNYMSQSDWALTGFYTVEIISFGIVAYFVGKFVIGTLFSSNKEKSVEDEIKLNKEKSVEDEIKLNKEKSVEDEIEFNKWLDNKDAEGVRKLVSSDLEYKNILSQSSFVANEELYKTTFFTKHEEAARFLRLVTSNVDLSSINMIKEINNALLTSTIASVTGIVFDSDTLMQIRAQIAKEYREAANSARFNELASIFGSESVQSESVQSESVQSESVQSESVQSESVQSESVQSESVQSESVQSESVQSESVQSESVQSEEFGGLQSATVFTYLGYSSSSGYPVPFNSRRFASSTPMSELMQNVYTTTSSSFSIKYKDSDLQDLYNKDSGKSGVIVNVSGQIESNETIISADESIRAEQEQSKEKVPIKEGKQEVESEEEEIELQRKKMQDTFVCDDVFVAECLIFFDVYNLPDQFSSMYNDIISDLFNPADQTIKEDIPFVKPAMFCSLVSLSDNKITSVRADYIKYASILNNVYNLNSKKTVDYLRYLDTKFDFGKVEHRIKYGDYVKTFAIINKKTPEVISEIHDSDHWFERSTPYVNSFEIERRERLPQRDD